MSRLTIVARLVARPPFRAQVESSARGLVAPTRAEKGCLQYDLHRSLDDPRILLFFENWESAADWEAHCRTPHFLAHRAATRDMVESAELLRMEEIDPR